MDWFCNLSLFMLVSWYRRDFPQPVGRIATKYLNISLQTNNPGIEPVSFSKNYVMIARGTQRWVKTVEKRCEQIWLVRRHFITKPLMYRLIPVLPLVEYFCSLKTALMIHPYCGIFRVSLSTTREEKGERAWFRGWVNSFHSYTPSLCDVTSVFVDGGFRSPKKLELTVCITPRSADCYNHFLHGIIYWNAIQIVSSWPRTSFLSVRHVWSKTHHVIAV